jgi:hypothetical protein
MSTTKTILAGLLLVGTAVLFTPATAASAAPIRPLEKAATATGSLVQAHYRYYHHRHRHCWWRHGHRHCGWW